MDEDDNISSLRAHAARRKVERSTGATEDGVAAAFVGMHEGRYLYCHETGAWFLWRDEIWRRDREQTVFHAVREFIRELVSVETPGLAPKSSLKTGFIGAVERLCKADPVFSRNVDYWDRDPYVLGTSGGTVDLRTGQLREARQEEGITKMAAAIPAEHSDCPIWLKFLHDVFKGDQEQVRFMQMWSGYCLTGDVSEHALLFGYGPGGNGKSVFTNTISGVLGDYATTAAMDTFTASRGDKHPADLAMLRGARLVTASETEEGRSWAEARIKQMTGGDPITARFMRQDFFTYAPQFKLLIVGNHKPSLVSVDDAIQRRFNIIPFDFKPPEPDPDLEAKLRAEWPAILRWMIDGCLDWQANRLIRPAAVKEATKEYFEDQDILSQWVSECCDVDKDNEFWWATSKELYESWSKYSKEVGEVPGTSKTFGSLMAKRFDHKRNAAGRGFKGVRLKPKINYDDR